MSEERRKKLQPRVYFVGAGYWPDLKSFSLGMHPERDQIKGSLFNTRTMDTEVAKLIKPSGWLLIYFVVTEKPGMQRVTKADAAWFLENQYK